MSKFSIEIEKKQSNSSRQKSPQKKEHYGCSFFGIRDSKETYAYVK